MKSAKEKCCVCRRHPAKYQCKINGEYLDKPICRKCERKIKMQDSEYAKNYNRKCTSIVTLLVLFVISFTMSSILIYCREPTGYDNVIKVFKSESKIIYLIVFCVINYIMGYISSYCSPQMKKWEKVIYNILMTVILTFVGCACVLSNEISFFTWDNPLVYLVPLVLCWAVISLVLMRIQKINKRNLAISTIILFCFTSIIFLFVSFYYWK